MLRSGSPDLVRQELAAWAAAVEMTRGVIRDAALAAAPARKGRRAGLDGPAPGPVLRPRRPGGPVRDPPRPRLLPGRDQRDRGTPEHRRPRPAPRPQVQVPLAPSPTPPRRTPPPASPPLSSPWPTPRLTSGNTEDQAEEDPAGPWTRPPPARHAALRHARRKGTTRSNQKQELPTTGQTSKAHGIEGQLGCGEIDNGTKFRMVWTLPSANIGVIADGSSDKSLWSWWTTADLVTCGC